MYQTGSMDCGVACLRMVCRFFGKNFNTEFIRSRSEFEIRGTSMFGLKNAAEKIGLETDCVEMSIDNIKKVLEISPIIIHWQKNHFTVIFSYKSGRFLIGDPAKGMSSLTSEKLSTKIFSANNALAACLVFEPTDKFNSQTETGSSSRMTPFFLEHIKNNKLYFLVILWGFMLVLSLQFILPFFSKTVVDLGISSGDITFVKYILLGQLMVIISSSIFSMIRSRITLHLSSKINYSMLSSFLGKLFKLPLPFFESRKIGDIIQRFSDHNRIEQFITKTSFSFVFSILSIVVYATVLAYFNIIFLILFVLSAMTYLAWITFFLNKRKSIDHERFEFSSLNQSLLVQIISGIHDLKINNAENAYFDKWKEQQAGLIKNSFKSFNISMFQESGATLIFQCTQVLLTYFSVSLVIKSRLTIGEMISIQFIIGQLIAPISQVVNTVLGAQDAKISFDRLYDIWSVKNEDEQSGRAIKTPVFQGSNSISIDNVSFEYPGRDQSFLLKDINILLPKGKVTAIVGLSGSGKTTLLKILLGYYENYTGLINIGDIDFRNIDLAKWRSACGVVLQESFIFNTTIAFNVSMSETTDYERLKYAIKIASLEEYIESLPMNADTMIGNEGKGLSQGQKQRILIARAVYKNPDYIFFDEATNSLDAETEYEIIKNLRTFFIGKTVLLIAHRLSTIQFADNVIVMRNGLVTEQGDLNQLMLKKGDYYNLVRKQLSEQEIFN